MSDSSDSIEDIIDRQGFTPFARRLLVLCGLVIVIDGFDLNAIGYAAPAMSKGLGIPLSNFGPIFSSSLLGTMFGSLLLSPLADRFGRKPMLLVSIAFFSVFTLMTAVANDATSLIAVRFLGGLGLGAATPVVVSLAAEYSPRAKRGLAIALLYAGFPVGGMLGGVVAAQMIPALGWKALFVVGGIAPMILGMVVWVAVPESWQFLARKKGKEKQFHALMTNGIPGRTGFTIPSKSTVPSSVGSLAQLFSCGRATATFSLWIAFFMILLLVIVIALWTPSLLRTGGVSAEQAAMITALISLGSAIGTMLLGSLIDKTDPFVLVAAAVLLGASCVAPFGLLVGSPMMLAACAIGSGFFLGSAAAGALVVSALIYPADIRATGVGWAYSFGKIGQVVGPMVAGGLLAAGFTVTQIFLSAVLPGLCAIIGLLVLRRRVNAQTGDSVESAVMELQ